LAWSSSSLLREFVSWRAIFIAPACFSAVVVILLILFFKEDPENYVAAVRSTTATDTPRPSLMANKGILVAVIFTVLAAIFHGVVRESINSWLPTMIEDTGIFSAGTTILILILTPCLNFGGLILTKKILAKCGSDAYRSAAIITAISVVICVLPPILGFIFTGKAYWILLVGLSILIFALMSALNPLFISFMPLDYVKYNLVSTMTGVIDFAVYAGAAISSLTTGILYGATKSWTGVTVMWLGSIVLCLVMLFIAKSIIKRNK
jgi:OPA family glycerol-3-phosphate transporter-like MFS transporter